MELLDIAHATGLRVGGPELAPHSRGGALGRRQANVGPLTAQHPTESHVQEAPEGHGDLVARVDVVVPVGPLETLLVENPHLLTEPVCELHTKRHEHRAFARVEVSMVQTAAPVAAPVAVLVDLGHIRPRSSSHVLGSTANYCR
jgi:hypothetical protein